MRHFLLILFLLNAQTGQADDPGGNTLYVRIVDTGPGLCTITRMPGPHYLVYDTGHWNGAVLCDLAVKRIVPVDAMIDLLVLSHSDSDHLGATDDILNTYRVKRVVRTGDVRWDTTTWRNAYWTIRRQREAGELEDINLWTLPGKAMPPGETYTYGDSSLVFVSGFNDPPSDWGIAVTDQSKMNNAISIVVRLVFAGRAVLFAGDAVGRTDDGRKDCWATEKYLVDNASDVPIQSDVIIAPHHGANNASSRCFIEAVDPDWVIFSAGNDHEHPRAATVQRYIDHGVPREHIFRTDLGDNEGGKEWSYGTSATGDRRGDDDVEIIITADGDVTVQYAQ